MKTFPTPGRSTTINNLNMVSQSELDSSLQAKTVIVLDDGSPRAIDLKTLHNNDERLKAIESENLNQADEIAQLQRQVADQEESGLQSRIIENERIIANHEERITQLEWELENESKNNSSMVFYHGDINGEASGDFLASYYHFLSLKKSWKSSYHILGDLNFTASGDQFRLPLPADKNFKFCNLGIYIRIGKFETIPSNLAVYMSIKVETPPRNFTYSDVHHTGCLPPWNMTANVYAVPLTLELGSLTDHKLTELRFDIKFLSDIHIKKPEMLYVRACATYYY